MQIHYLRQLYLSCKKQTNIRVTVSPNAVVFLWSSTYILGIICFFSVLCLVLTEARIQFPGLSVSFPRRKWWHATQQSHFWTPDKERSKKKNNAATQSFCSCFFLSFSVGLEIVPPMRAMMKNVNVHTIQAMLITNIHLLAAFYSPFSS